MKTKNYNFISVSKQVYPLFRFGLQAAIFFFLGITATQAQGTQVNVSLAGVASGNGLGTFFLPQATFSLNRHSIAAGINIQTQHNNVSGFRGRYEYTFNPWYVQELFLFYDFTFNSNAYLGAHTARQESSISPEFSGYFNNVKLKTIEHHVGFGLNVLVYGPLRIFGAAGAGYYHTMGSLKRNLFQYREKNDCALMVMAGLKLSLKQNKKVYRHSRNSRY